MSIIDTTPTPPVSTDLAQELLGQPPHPAFHLARLDGKSPHLQLMHSISCSVEDPAGKECPYWLAAARGLILEAWPLDVTCVTAITVTGYLVPIRREQTTP